MLSALQLKLLIGVLAILGSIGSALYLQGQKIDRVETATQRISQDVVDLKTQVARDREADAAYRRQARAYRQNNGVLPAGPSQSFRRYRMP